MSTTCGGDAMDDDYDDILDDFEDDDYDDYDWSVIEAEDQEFLARLWWG